MKHTRLLATLLACLSLSPLAAAQGTAPPRTEQGNLIFDGVPLEAVNAPSTLPRWLESRSASFVDWLADGSMVIATRFGNTTQLHRVRAAGGMREQFTFEAEPVSVAVAQPYEASQLLFMKDVGGNEQRQIWLHDLGNGSDRLLTDGKSRYDTPVFARDGKRIAFAGNQRDASSNDIYLRDLAGEALPRLLLAGGSDDLYVQDWSLDDRRLAVIRYRSSTDSELLLVDVDSGVQTRIEPATGTSGKKGKAAPGPVSVAGAQFSRDGRGLYFLSDRGGEFIGLHYIDLYTGQATDLTPGNSWDIGRFRLAPDGRYLAYTRNEAGIDRLVLRDLQLKADLLLPPLPQGAVVSSMGFDRTGRQLAVTVETAAAPADVLVYGIGAELDANGLARVSATPWTRSELGPIDPAKLVAARLVEFPTWDRDARGARTISAFVMQPATPGPHPVFIEIHGGPESQARPTFNAFRQFLVNELGYAVVTPNVRGSSGYGRSFLKLDDGELREDSVRDIGALLVWLGMQKDFDRNRVVVAGGSYGGYMTLASLVQFGDRLAGGIDTVGISNFVTFLTNTSGYRRDLRRVEYGDERDPKMRAVLQSISPLTNANRIRKPLLVVQGLNDPRVPPSESEQMMRMVRAQGGEVWYLAAKDEGHGFRKKANTDVYRATMVAFLRKLAAR
jgi:dipeptidyl aminopeptidase/acylaminoacyl peptidase